MTPLITGGCGFIGSHLCEFHHADGGRVAVLDDLSSGSHANLTYPEYVKLSVGDIADGALVEQLVAQASMVFHLAAIASVVVCANEPAKAQRTNVAGTQTIFDAVAKIQTRTGRKIPVVYASSAAIYGDNPNIPLAESATPSPINVYGEHKLENERIAARAFAKDGVNSVGLRFFNVYGPRQDPSSPYSGVISKFVDGAKAGRDLTIFGDGEQTRDFIYVRDVVRMLVGASGFANKNAGAHLFNVCTGKATNLKTLAHTIMAAVGRNDLPIQHAPARTGDIRHSLGDPARIIEALKPGQWTALNVGLDQTLGEYA